MDDNISPEDFKNAVIILALDKLAYLYENSLEGSDKLTKEEYEHYIFMSSYCRDLINDLGKNLILPHIIPRPKW